MLKEFREFALRGNALDLAIGLVIGAAFTSIVDTLVNGVLMPPLGLLLGGADFTDLFIVLEHGEPSGPYQSLALAQEAGAVTLNYGLLVNALVSFVVIAFALFLVVKSINRLYREGAVSGQQN
jgi:large conductance mechanosensitive channel